ncbi:MAG: uroporphyrin-III C-methyltransferase / precorrin-2 dehydrogenase / sirohydrochlorin ferrochelatase [Actinomycetota bacterium]|nr:uroporphyrin-III C-methyltransferase / precorrin-2 dehydrogenase / sirohydrochlorin ferrochelatase [Actinomycetota bacterium]
MGAVSVTGSAGRAQLVTPEGALAPPTVTGSVPQMALVGGGPGEPDLLTVRAEALMAEATTVVADASVLHLANAFAPDATIVAVADRGPAIDVLLGAARPVVRLYAGDTWLHPAHGAEAAALTAAGVDYEAVAGVATEIALPALAGIAVHVRQLAVACTIIDIDHAPTPTDPARTLVRVTDDLRAAAAADPAAVALATAGGGGLLVSGAVVR